MPTKDVIQITKADEVSKRIHKLYVEMLGRATKYVNLTNIPPDVLFELKNYPKLKDGLDKLMNEHTARSVSIINNATQEQWLEAYNKNMGIASPYLKRGLLTEAQQLAYTNRNLEALGSFQQRKINGLGLSDRIWKYNNQFKGEIEMGIDAALGDGTSAQEISKRLRSYLNDPDKLFRRVRDKHGNLHLSKMAEKYSPGPGVYRSSYKNAMRLARTEVNMAYRASDNEKYKQFDFVTGFEIKRSNHLYGCDICEELKGIYPKEFRFVGWHPQCRCFTVPILNKIDDFIEQQKALLNGETYTPSEQVGMNSKFMDWYKTNSAKIDSAKNKPYFIRDNAGLIKNTSSADEAINSKLKSLVKNTRIELKDRPDGTIYRDFENRGTTASELTTEELKAKFGEPIYLKNITKIDKEIVPDELSKHIKDIGKSVIDKHTAAQSVQKIGIENLTFPQEFVFDKAIRMSDGKAISIINYKGKNYVMDGNHSLARQILEGKKEILSKVTYIDDAGIIVSKPNISTIRQFTEADFLGKYDEKIVKDAFKLNKDYIERFKHRGSEINVEDLEYYIQTAKRNRNASDSMKILSLLKQEQLDIFKATGKFNIETKTVKTIEEGVSLKSKKIIEDIASGKFKLKSTGYFDRIEELRKLGYDDVADTVDQWIQGCQLYSKNNDMPNLKSLQDTFKFMSDRQEIEGTLYRGISIESNKELKSIAKFYQDNVGNSIDMGRSSQGYFHDYPAFSSTTKRMVADDYSMGFEDAYSIRFVIKGNGGVLKGFDMREFGLPDSEVILPFSKKYRVDKITKYVNDLDKKSYEITLTQM